MQLRLEGLQASTSHGMHEMNELKNNIFLFVLNMLILGRIAKMW